jgi:O-acetyl-ADP-ribose deacetylase (regulator of RNase III)
MTLKQRLEAIEADISLLAYDAIVNAANAPLQMGGGVDGAIRRKAGIEMENDLRKIGRCPPGDAIITKGYRLAAKYVIHTVAPMWNSGHSESQKDELLASCYRNALIIASQKELSSIAFPAIGTGIYGWPPHRAAKIAFSTVVDHLQSHALPERIVFCCFSREDLERYGALIDELAA